MGFPPESVLEHQRDGILLFPNVSSLRPALRASQCTDLLTPACERILDDLHNCLVEPDLSRPLLVVTLLSGTVGTTGIV